MSHLGRWLSALVDGELDGTERDRVLNHVAGCAACRQEANAMRALKRRLTALGDTCAESPIAGRLIELAHNNQGPSAGGGFSQAPWSAATFDPRPVGVARHPRVGWKIATGSATGALLAIGVVAFLLGNASGAQPVPKITPSVDSYLVQHSYDAGQEPAGSTPATGSGSAAGQPGSAWYWSKPATQARLDPRRPGTVQLGQLAEPVRQSVRPTPSSAPVVPTKASPSPAASATASPVASAPVSPGHSSPPHSPSRSSR